MQSLKPALEKVGDVIKTLSEKWQGLSEGQQMTIIKIAGVGILVAIASQILSKTGRDEQAMFVTIAGIVVTLMLLVSRIRELFDLILSVFGI